MEEVWQEGGPEAVLRRNKLLQDLSIFRRGVSLLLVFARMFGKKLAEAAWCHP